MPGCITATRAALPVLFAAAALLAGCAGLKPDLDPPKVSLVSLRLIEPGLFEQRYGLTLRVQNPNATALPITGVSYVLKVAGEEFATGVTPEAFRIPAYGESDVKLEVTTNIVRSLTTLADWLGAEPDKLDYEVSGKLQVDLPFVGAVPFNRSGEITLITK